MRGRRLVTFPERIVRAGAAILGGAVHETAQVVLPRFVRQSRVYEATAKNVLRIAIELVGGVEQQAAEDDAPSAGQLAVRKGAGNVVELGSIAAFGFSPLWLLAAASDLARGSRVYLSALVGELKDNGVLEKDAEIASVDQLLGVLERGAGKSAALIDIPPMELKELRTSIAELAAERKELPGPDELQALYEGLIRQARAENRSLLAVSSGIGLAFLNSAQHVGRDHVWAPYREDWRPLRQEGFGAYARRVARPYRAAVEGHFDESQTTLTERLLRRIRKS
ncbi:MAG: hypothetical protein ACTHKS_16450 [Gaiellaceae bacterium]